jgi:uncharacterized membrane protein
MFRDRAYFLPAPDFRTNYGVTVSVNVAEIVGSVVLVAVMVAVVLEATVAGAE